MIQKKSYPHGKEKLTEEKEILLDKILQADNKIVSIDETSFLLGQRPDRGWSRKNKRCIMNVSNKRKRYTVVMAVNRNNIINYKIVSGSHNGESFKKFIVDDVLPLITDEHMLMDNARVHWYKGLKQYLIENDTPNKIIYNIPYCPEYNPIEFIFNTIKSLYKNSLIETLNDLKKFLAKITRKLNRKGFKKYFNHSFENLLN